MLRLRSRNRARGFSGGGGVTPWYTLGKADGVDPSLWADFVNNRYAVNGVEAPFADVFTHTRASTATYFDASGVMQTAAVNTPRFDYDPVTLLPNGLLLEEQRTNVLEYSKSPITHWFGIGATTSAAAGTMLGYFSGGITVASAGATWHRSRPDNISWTNAVVQSWSTFVRAGTSGKIRVSFSDTVAATESSASGTLGAVLTVTATAAGAVTHDKTISLGGGYYILSGTFTPNSTMAGQGQFAVGPNSAVVGETIDLFGAQFEAGAFPTSFIETTTAAVTRSGDSILNSSANVVPFASWYNQTEGCFNPEFTYIGQSAGSYPQMMFAIDNTTSNRIGILVDDSGTPKVGFQSFVSSVYQGIGVAALDPTGILLKAAGAYKNNDGAISFNGLGAVSDATFGIPTVDRLNVTTSSSPACVYMRQARYYPIRVTNPELVRITT